MEIALIFLWVMILAVIVLFLLFRKRWDLFYRPRLLIRLKEQEAMVIEQMGKFKRVIYSGVNLIIPFLQGPRIVPYKKGEISEALDLRDVVFDFQPIQAITKDKASVTVDGFIIVKIENIKRLAYEVDNFPVAIEKLTEAGLRNVIGEMDMDDILASREEINNKLQNHLLVNIKNWGVIIRNAEIKDISPKEEIVNAMNSQNVAMRAKMVTFQQAEGEARMLEEASRVLGNKAIASKYLATLRYVEAFKELVNKKDGKVVFIPYEGGNLTSSLSFMKEFFAGRDTASSEDETKME